MRLCTVECAFIAMVLSLIIAGVLIKIVGVNQNVVYIGCSLGGGVLYYALETLFGKKE